VHQLHLGVCTRRPCQRVMPICSQSSKNVQPASMHIAKFGKGSRVLAQLLPSTRTREQSGSFFIDDFAAGMSSASARLSMATRCIPTHAHTLRNQVDCDCISICHFLTDSVDLASPKFSVRSLFLHLLFVVISKQTKKQNMSCFSQPADFSATLSSMLGRE
jgi:hypothetical protein